MAKGASYSNLMSKKMRRTILRSPLQFLTMTLILALASTLFSGLYASHLAFKGQIDEIYTKGNMADVTTTLNYSGELSGEDPAKDYQLITDTIGSAGEVETHYHASAKIQGLDANVTISDTYPTINKPYEIINDKATSKDNYLYFCDNYLHVEMNYGKRENWIDEQGNYKEIVIQLNISDLKNRLEDISHPELNNALKEFVKPDKDAKNILDGDHLDIKVTPTGSMVHPENIASNITQPFTFITTRTFLAPALTKALEDNYDIARLRQKAISETNETKKAIYKECIEIIDNEIMGYYWGNNRCVSRLNNRNEATIYRDKIDNAFEHKKDGGKYNILFNVQLSDTVTHQQLITDMMQSVQLCYVFPPVFFLVAILIVLTTISQIILKERKEIGTLKAIGASNRSILTYYMGLTGIISLVGVAIGLIAGPLLLPTILDAKYKMLYNLPKVRFVFPTAVAIAMTLVVLIITMLVAFLITRKEAKALPVTSMRPKPVNIKKKNLSENKKEANTHKLCFKMATRNIFCSASRSIMVIIGVLGCTALLCCGFGIDDCVKRGIDNDTQMFFNTDSIIYFSNQSEETFRQIENLQIDGKKAVTQFEPYGYLPVSASQLDTVEKSFSTHLYSIPYYLDKDYKFFNLGYLPHGSEIVISNQVAKKLNLKEGDPINFEFLGKTYGGIVTKIIDVFYMHGIYVDGNSTFFPKTKDYPTCAYARFNKELDEGKVINAIKNIEAGGVASVLNHDSLTKQVNNISSSIGYITITIKVFAILLAVVALYNLALLNFKENIRNIATMKVLGFNRREVAESLFFEIIILSTIGALIGLTLGYPLTLLTLGINQVPMCEFFYYVSALSFILSLIITIGVTAIINIFVGLRSKQVKMVESLKSIE